MIEMSKDVTLGGITYRVGRVRPHVGCWLLSTLNRRRMAAMESLGGTGDTDAPMPGDTEAAGRESKQPEPTREEKLQATAQFLIGNLDLAEMEQVQNLCLERCARYEEIGGRQVAMPILSGPGRWAIADMEYDGLAVMQLVRECLAFNISPFFIDAGSSSTT